MLVCMSLLSLQAVGASKQPETEEDHHFDQCMPKTKGALGEGITCSAHLFPPCLAHRHGTPSGFLTIVKKASPNKSKHVLSG